eukprot:86168-Rhodomonas_salina.2
MKALFDLDLVGCRWWEVSVLSSAANAAAKAGGLQVPLLPTYLPTYLPCTYPMSATRIPQGPTRCPLTPIQYGLTRCPLLAYHTYLADAT